MAHLYGPMYRVYGSDFAMVRRIGVFGGSFNPIHIGHLIIAEAAWQEFSLEKILFVPTADTPNKAMHHIDKYMRFHMVALATAGNSHFVMSSIELEREGPSYTVDTIRLLKQNASPDTEFYFIAGTDAVANLPTWKYNKELLESCHFICASRPGDIERVHEAIRYFGPLGKEKIHFLNTPELEISSTILRRLISKNRSVRYMIPDAVIAYIKKENLYKENE